MYIDHPKSSMDILIRLVLRLILGSSVAAFALLVELGSFSIRMGSYFASNYMDSDSSTFVDYVLSSPVYLVLPVTAGLLAALFPGKVARLLIWSGEDTYGYW